MQSRNSSGGQSIGLDAAGNRYVAGWLYGTVLLDTITLTVGNANTHAYLAKYSPTGAVLWARTLETGGAYTPPTELAVDALGNVYWTGTYQNFLTAGSTSFTGDYGAFLLKYNTQGVQQWAFDGGPRTTAGGIATDAAGNVTLAGGYTTTVAFGGTALTGGGQYCYRLSPTGVAQQALRISADQIPYLGIASMTLCIDGAGNTYIGGSLFGTVTVGATTLSSNANYKMFLYKLTPAGTVAWARLLPGGSYSDKLQRLATDASGNVLVSGCTDLNGSIAPIYSNLYVGLFSPQGAPLWQHAYPASTGGVPVTPAVAYDGRGGYWLSGDFQLTSVTIGSTTLWGAPSALVVRYDGQGTPTWVSQGVIVRPASSPGPIAFSSNAPSIVADASGNMHLTGGVAGQNSFGPFVTTGNGFNVDTYVATISAGGVLTAARPATAGLALQAYPNPASGTATVVLPTGGGRLDVLDALGRTVRRQALPAAAGPCAVPLQGLAPGLYQLRATLGNGQLAHTALQVQ
jgi:hypothetical protein